MNRNRILRVIDANLNRAGEALREIEDAARFVLNSHRLSQRTKKFRHQVGAASKMLGLAPAELPAARDSSGDVGRPDMNQVGTCRLSVGDVVTAAFKRLQQALRTLEEYAKLLDVDGDPGFEPMRYASYQLEKELMARMCPNRFLQRARLYLVLIGDLLPGISHREAVGAALEGGVDIVQIREKAMGDRQLLELARPLVDACHQAGALCLVNDRPQVALASGADGVHLGNDDLPIDAARALLGPDLVVGGTAHSLEEAEAAQAAGADYVGFGTIFATSTKTGLNPRGPEGLDEILQSLHLPVFPIGGINRSNLDPLIDIGIGRVAVSSAILRADDISAAAGELKEKLLEVDL